MRSNWFWSETINNVKLIIDNEDENIIRAESYQFAVIVVNLYKFLVEDRKEFVLSKQLLCSGTSIGEHVRETEHAESKADFIHKLSITLKEANETEYWIDLLKETSYLNNSEYISI